MKVEKIKRSALIVAKASKGNPLMATATVMLFYIMFNTLEAVVEVLIYGNRFEHWFDVVFGIAFIAYAAYVVYWCGIYNLMEKDESVSVPLTSTEPNDQ
jgi:hypothetical protein